MSQTPSGATEQGDGIVVGDGPVRVDSFIDFLCPYCGKFEEDAGSVLDGLVADGSITLVWHPMAFLDRLSTNRYSTRSAAASGCAADEGKFSEYLKVLFANQPPEGGAGHSDETLIELGEEQAGLQGTGFADCLTEGRFADWPALVTDYAGEDGVGGTPTVFVDGEQVEPTAAAVGEAVEACS